MGGCACANAPADAGIETVEMIMRLAWLLCDDLAGVFDWYGRQPSASLSGRTPLQLVEDGEGAAVIDFLLRAVAAELASMRDAAGWIRRPQR